MDCQRNLSRCVKRSLLFSECNRLTVTIRLELDIETGELLFEWASLDHVSPDGMSQCSLPFSGDFC